MLDVSKSSKSSKGNTNYANDFNDQSSMILIYPNNMSSNQLAGGKGSKSSKSSKSNNTPISNTAFIEPIQQEEQADAIIVNNNVGTTGGEQSDTSVTDNNVVVPDGDISNSNANSENSSRMSQV